MNREPGELSHEFARAASGHAPRHEPGDLSREFNYAATPAPPPPNAPASELHLEPPGGGGPTVGPGMSIAQQCASRLAEMQQSLSEQFRRAAKEKEKANEPQLER